ncbi:MAG: exonuclease [Bacillota bacterium]
MSLHLTFYDGVDCIGGNKILLEADGSKLFFDFGTNFKAEGTFFDEFLCPRVVLGLGDPLALGLLPPLKGLYRPDLEYPGVWERFAESPLYRDAVVQGVLLSHAHLDHCGYISYLHRDIPVLCSLTTALTCKAMQDTSSGNRLQEICYINPREFTDGLLKTGNYRRVFHEQRPYVVFAPTTVSGPAVLFWEQCHNSRGLNCRPFESFIHETRVGDLTVRYWPVDHSIPGAGAFGVRTSAGWVVYTGDLRIHGRQASLTKRFIAEAAGLGPVVLVCEGTHPLNGTPVTEAEVLANSFEAVRGADGLVVADFGPRNVERLLSFLEIAAETGRRLALTPKDAYLLEGLCAAGEPGVPDPYVDERVVLYVKPKGTLFAWEKALLERFSVYCPERMVDAKTVRGDQSGFILCFSYYDFHALLDINPYGGTYIYSSSEAFDEEMLIDHERVRNWINYFGFKLCGSLGKDREKSGFHASGHIHGAGLEELVETINPDILVPVHTQDREFFRQFEGRRKVLLPRRGETVAID